MVNTAVILSLLAVIITKFLDCYTTLMYIRSYQNETNPIARKLMAKFGFKKVIYGILIVTVIITFLVGISAIITEENIYKYSVIIAGLLISFIQFTVALTNLTGKYNIFTKLLKRIYRS